MTATEVYNLYRSIYSFKNILTSFNNEVVKIIELTKFDMNQLHDEIADFQPGAAVFCKKSKKLLVMCADHNFVEITQLSINVKKKVMSAADFNNGFLKKCREAERKFV
jgi:methionyl-tRNA formyltransferase